VLQTIFYPFEVYSQHCGHIALDVHWQGDTFDGGAYSGVRVLDVAATLDEHAKRAAIFIVNRTQEQPSEVQIVLETGHFTGNGEMYVVNGADIKVENTFESPDQVTARSVPLIVTGNTLTLTIEPHSVTAVLLDIT
jgi:alpha-N-arabinofuranosidase